ISVEWRLLGTPTPAIRTHIRKRASCSSIYRWTKYFRRHGSTLKPKTFSRPNGRPRLLTRRKLEAILDKVDRNPLVTLQSLALWFCATYHRPITPRTIHRYLQRERWTFKRVESRAMEFDPVKETLFLLKLEKYKPWQLVYADETHVNDRTGNALYGWAKRGKRAKVRRSLNRGVGYSAVGLLTTQGLLSVPVIRGAYNMEETLWMLRNHVSLLPLPFPDVTPY
ncbi:hypothetical protein JCM11251_002084, partial [Rhodosporidiobolus azoricus]